MCRVIFDQLLRLFCTLVFTISSSVKTSCPPIESVDETPGVLQLNHSAFAFFIAFNCVSIQPCCTYLPGNISFEGFKKRVVKGMFVTRDRPFFYP